MFDVQNGERRIILAKLAIFASVPSPLANEQLRRLIHLRYQSGLCGDELGVEGLR
jgi:hypothetical protein